MFTKDIEAFATKALLQASNSVSNITEELLGEVVMNTPSPENPGQYSKGLLANQWYTESGGLFSSALGSATNAAGMGSLSRIKESLASKPFLGKDNTVTMTNNVSYAYRAENLGWPAGEGENGWHWSGRVGPYKMVGKAISKIEGKYAK